VALADPGWTESNEEREAALSENPQLPSGVLLAWFDHWLAQLPDVPIPPEPTFTSFEGPTGAGAGWRELDGWDAGGAAGTDLELPPDGPRHFRQPAASDDEVDALTFTSDPLAADLVLVGHPSLTFRATLDAADAHFYVELLEVADAGDETWVNDGFLAASHRRSHTEPEPVPVGEPTDYRIAIRPHHHRFRAGSRVRVRVSGGPPSKLTAPPTPVTVTIEAAPAAVLRLPGFSDPG
jgi:uncharacterized protein